MEITLFDFSKKVNSTKIPAHGGTTVKCQLKDDTSLYNPSFLICTVQGYKFNYLKWDNRYYYITDVRFNNADNTTTLICTIDVLGSYRNDIFNTTSYILYSSSEYDKDIPDSRLSSCKDIQIKETISNVLDTKKGMYFVSVISTSDINSWYVNTDTKRKLISKTMDNDMIKSLIYDAGDYIAKKIDSASNCITELHYLPIMPAHDEIQGSILLGTGYDTELKGYPANHFTGFTAEMVIPWQYQDWRNHSNFTSLLIYLPAYGVATLNADDFYGKDKLTIDIRMDSFNGELVYLIENKYRYITNVAVQEQVSNVQNSSLGGVGMSLGTAIGTAIASGFTGSVGGLAVALGSGFNAIKGTLDRSTGSTGSYGGSSSFDIDKNIHLITLTHPTNIEPDSVNDLIGRPLNQIKLIGSLTGYVQTNDFSVISNCPETMKNDINNMMNGGVYLE